MGDKKEDAYARYICNLLDKDIRYTKDAFFEFEKISISNLLKKYQGIKLFMDNQEIFKNMFFKCIFTAKKTDYKARHFNAISKILEEDNSKYDIAKRQETMGSNKGKYYWIIGRRE